MKPRIPLLLLTVLALLLGACSAENAPPTAEPALDVITLQTTPSLAHWLSEAAACANTLPGVGIYTKLLPVEDLDLEAADLTLRLGNPLDTDPLVTALGTETLVIIAGPDAPAVRLSLESLQAIFTGEIPNWNAVPEVRDAGLTVDQPITVLSYPEGNDLRQLFAEIYLDSARLMDRAQTFSTMEYLETLLEQNPAAITYALASQAPPTAQVLPISGMEQRSATQYVLGITHQEPEGALKALLLCLQAAGD